MGLQPHLFILTFIIQIFSIQLAIIATCFPFSSATGLETKKKYSRLAIFQASKLTLVMKFYYF